MKDEKLFSEYMATFSEIFDKEISKTVTKIYWETLEPFSDEDCEEAFKILLATNTFFPKPVDFLRILKGDPKDTATIAWTKVDEAMRNYGAYLSMNLSDPIAHKVIEHLGGWEYLGSKTEQEWRWLRQDFEVIYNSMNREKAMGLDHIEGIMEKTNRAKGHEKFTPKVIQLDPKKRRLLE